MRKLVTTEHGFLNAGTGKDGKPIAVSKVSLAYEDLTLKQPEMPGTYWVTREDYDKVHKALTNLVANAQAFENTAKENGTTLLGFSKSLAEAQEVLNV